MRDPPQPSSPAPRDWTGEAWRSAVLELHHFVATAYQFTRRPVRFATSWRAGDDSAMNPIGFLGTAAVFVGTTHQLTMCALGSAPPSSFYAAIANVLGPYVHYTVLALICHLVLRAAGGKGRREGNRRPRTVDSVAFALYAGGGPAAAAECALWIVVLALSPVLPTGSTPWLIAIGLGLAFTVFCAALATSVSILHEARPWHLMLAFAVAFPLMGLFFGLVDPPGQYGMHWVVTLWGPDGHLAPRLTLGL